jgi:cell division septum initiation protein DivIVA
VIEDKIEQLEKRLEQIERRFDALKTALASSAGDEVSQALLEMTARLESRERSLVVANKAASEFNSLIVELARTLGVRGNITRDRLLAAAQEKAKDK